MTFILPFKEEFAGEMREIFAVNEDNPKGGITGSSITTYEECPHCNKGNVFRVYHFKAFKETEDMCIEIYDCKCPNCRNEFDLKVEFEL